MQTISFLSLAAALKPEQSVTRFEIPSAQAFVLYLLADLLQTEHTFSLP